MRRSSSLGWEKTEGRLCRKTAPRFPHRGFSLLRRGQLRQAAKSIAQEERGRSAWPFAFGRVAGPDRLWSDSSCEESRIGLRERGGEKSVGSVALPAHIAPEDAGLPRHSIAAIHGGDPEYNARALRRLLSGEHGAYREFGYELVEVPRVSVEERAAFILARVGKD